MKSKASKVVLDWLERADSDFAFAELSFKEFDNFYSQMCVLCHDAVEKYLKAYLISQKKQYKKIHDLVTLIKDCINISKHKRFNTFEDGCRILNNYYTPLKYPSHYPFATRKQASEAIEIAKKIRDFIKNIIL